MLRSAAFIVFLFVGNSMAAQVFEQETIPKVTDSYEFKKINLDVKTGIAFPVGGFADSDILSEEAGFANIGPSFGVEFNAKPKDFIGFGVDLSAVSNGYNTDPYDYIAERDSIFSGIATKNYFNLKMLGVFSLGVANHNLEADIKFMIGPMYSVLPEQTIANTYVSATLNQTRKRSSSLGLCAGMGFNTRYYFKSFYLKSFADYTSATVLHDVEYTLTGAGFIGSETLTTNIKWVTLGVGIGIRF